MLVINGDRFGEPTAFSIFPNVLHVFGVRTRLLCPRLFDLGLQVLLSGFHPMAVSFQSDLGGTVTSQDSYSFDRHACGQHIRDKGMTEQMWVRTLNFCVFEDRGQSPLVVAYRILRFRVTGPEKVLALPQWKLLKGINDRLW